MNKYEIVKKIEEFAPLESAEGWDCSGWGVETNRTEISRIMICLTVTDKVISQAKALNCDMIISHHPLFYVPLNWNDIDIYSAHTNLDKAKGGTTDTLIKALNLEDCQIQINHEFLRLVEFSNPISLNEFSEKIKTVSINSRLINNKNIETIKKVAFCAGSGSEFIKDAQDFGANCLVTGDLKFHTALDSPIVIYDIGHFESEILIRPILQKIIGENIETIFADERTPFELL